MGHNDSSYANAPLEYQSETGRLNILGFWIFLGAEIVLFSTLLRPTLFFMAEQLAAFCQLSYLI